MNLRKCNLIFNCIETFVVRNLNLFWYHSRTSTIPVEYSVLSGHNWTNTVINELWRFRSSHIAYTMPNDVRNHCSKRQVYYLWFRRTLNLLLSRPLPSPPLHFSILGPLWQIFTWNPIILKICMPLFLHEGPQSTKFQPSNSSGTCFFKASKTPKSAIVYSSTAGFHALVCRSVACALSFVFWVRGYFYGGGSAPTPPLKVGAAPPRPPFGPGALASAMTTL